MMRYMKYLFKSIHLLNIILVISVIFMVHNKVLPVLNISEKTGVLPDKEILIEEEKKQAGWQSPSFSDFIVIAEQNLFNPSRSIVLAEETASVQSLPQIILYGTLITDDFSIAYLEDKQDIRSTPGRGKRQMRMKKGDKLRDYVISEVEADYIVLLKGEERIVVSINDMKKRYAAPTNESSDSKIPSEIYPHSGRTALQANESVEGAINDRSRAIDVIRSARSIKMPITKKKNPSEQ
ncbi:MAG: hypothetical protein KJ826_08365 [Proteobacteria bacterium]|nr:hypothetical protein [Pseudomonadota bacterium]